MGASLISVVNLRDYSYFGSHCMDGGICMSPPLLLQFVVFFVCFFIGDRRWGHEHYREKN